MERYPSGVSTPTSTSENAFGKSRVQSLDPAREDYARRKAQLEQEVAALDEAVAYREIEEDQRLHEESMRFLKNSESPGLSKNSNGVSAHPYHNAGSALNNPVGFAAYAAEGSTPFRRNLPPEDLYSQQDQQPNTSSRLTLDSPDHLTKRLPKLVDGEVSSGSASSPSRNSLIHSPPQLKPCDNTKKRRRASTSLAGENALKSIRTTPSPAMTGTTTPSSLESFEIAKDSDLYRLLGGDPNEHLYEFKEEQRLYERALLVKREQERRDAEFARQLDRQFNSTQNPPSGGRVESLPGHLVDSNATSQCTLDQNGRLCRDPAEPSPSIMKKEQAPPYAWPLEQDSRQFLTHPTTKHETSAGASNQGNTGAQTPIFASNYNDYIDLRSDNDEKFGSPNSDVVVVDSGSWQDNGRRHRQHQPLPWPQTASGDWNSRSLNIDQSLAGNPYLPEGDLNYANSGGAGVYDNGTSDGYGTSSNHSGWGSLAQMGQNFYGAAKGTWDTVSSNLGQHLPSFPGLAAGYDNSVYSSGLMGSPSPSMFNDSAVVGQSDQILAHRLMNHHAINPDDPSNRTVVDRYVDRVNYLANDPTRTASEIKNLLENIRPDEELPPENREGTPDAMTYALMEHQKLGLAWMKSMEEGSNKGGILADDMGLGKTIQALALLVSRRSSDARRKTTLIVAPVALMKQWEREIRTKLKSGFNHKLSTYVLHGTGRGASWDHLRSHDVVLTTFGTLATEFKRKEAAEKAKISNPAWRPLGRADHLPLLGDECLWYRVIIDEAQCIKNKSTKAAQGACALHSLTRWCLSGTPMQNSPSEIYSLIRFLRIKPYNSQERFNHDLARPLKSNMADEKAKGMRKLQALLKAVLLRRNKKSQIDGKPILSLPERTTEIQAAELSDDELAFYTALESNTQLQFNKYLKAGTVGRNYSNILVLLLRLRQACCHPHLIKDFGISNSTTDITIQDLVNFAKDLQPDVVTRIIEQGAPNNQEALECPVCMDMTENATIFIPCGHNTCSECFTRISDPSQAIADGYEGGRGDIKCPNCRGKVDTSKVTSHNAFKKVHMPEQFGHVDEDLQEDVGTDEPSDSDDEFSDEEDSEGDLRSFVVPDDIVEDSATTDEFQAGNTHESHPNDGVPFKTRTQPSEHSVKHKGKGKLKGKGKEKPTHKPRPTLAQLKKEGARNAKSRRRYLARLKKDWKSSAKIDRTMEILRAIQDRGQGEKTIVFSQFTSLLDLLEVPIFDAGWNCKRYDGSMSPQARNEAVLDFTDKNDCKIMLVSLKAGNAGLNLVAASEVIILDPFWNPYIEEQAVDRAHRIGQMRPVHVHRVLVKETVEDRILALQEKKRQVIEAALDEKASENIGRLGTRELAFLFVSIHGFRF